MGLISLLGYFLDRKLGKTVKGVRRSSQWPKVRKEYLLEHPKCECCGGSKLCQCHHKLPFNLFPELELDKGNLMTLCKKKSCHIAMGHLYYFRSYNPNIEADIKAWREKVEARP